MKKIFIILSTIIFTAASCNLGSNNLPPANQSDTGIPNTNIENSYSEGRIDRFAEACIDKKYGCITGWAYDDDKPLEITIVLKNITDSHITEVINLNSSQPHTNQYMFEDREDVSSILADKNIRDAAYKPAFFVNLGAIEDGKYQIKSATFNGKEFTIPTDIKQKIYVQKYDCYTLRVTDQTDIWHYINPTVGFELKIPKPWTLPSTNDLKPIFTYAQGGQTDWHKPCDLFLEITQTISSQQNYDQLISSENGYAERNNFGYEPVQGIEVYYFEKWDKDKGFIYKHYLFFPASEKGFVVRTNVRDFHGTRVLESFNIIGIASADYHEGRLQEPKGGWVYVNSDNLTVEITLEDVKNPASQYTVSFNNNEPQGYFYVFQNDLSLIPHLKAQGVKVFHYKPRFTISFNQGPTYVPNGTYKIKFAKYNGYDFQIEDTAKVPFELRHY